jgi:hypothetical protein
LLEQNQKPKTNVIGGVIYILRALNADISLYKLGKTKDLKNRLNTYNSGNANDVEPLFIIQVKDIDSVESCVKNACKKYQYRKYKEIYEIDIEVLKEVISECDYFTNKIVKLFSDKKEKKNFKTKINRMLLKQDKYFMFLSKNDTNNQTNQINQINANNVLDV